MQYLIKGLRFTRIGTSTSRTFSVSHYFTTTGGQASWYKFEQDQAFQKPTWNTYGEYLALVLTTNNRDYVTNWTFVTPTASKTLQLVNDEYIFEYLLNYTPQGIINLISSYGTLPAKNITTDYPVGSTIRYGDVSSTFYVHLTNVDTFEPFLRAVADNVSDAYYLEPFYNGFEIESETSDLITINFKPHNYKQWYKEIWDYNPISKITIVTDTKPSDISPIPSIAREQILTVTDVVFEREDISLNNLYHSISF